MSRQMVRLLVFVPIAIRCLGLSAAETANVRPENKVIKRFPVKVNQAVAVDAEYFYAISNTTVLKCDKKTGATVTTWQAKERKSAEHIKHLNSGAVVDGRLYCAHSRFPVDPNDNTVEIWDIRQERLEHERTIAMPREHGSITWIDRRKDGSWWICYAVYGKGKNKNTKLVRCCANDGHFVEEKVWTFPAEVVDNWGGASCSGGSWGPDGHLYTTGHDDFRCDVLNLDANDKLTHLRTETHVGFFGQGIAWDRSSGKPILWGIVKKQDVSLTLIPEKPMGK